MLCCILFAVFRVDQLALKPRDRYETDSGIYFGLFFANTAKHLTSHAAHIAFAWLGISPDIMGAERRAGAPVKGNSLLPPAIQVTREELMSISSEKLSISRDEVVSLRSRFLEITDGDLLTYCTGLLVEARPGTAETEDAVRRIYALGQAVCSMKHAALKMAVEHEFEYFARAAEGLSMPSRLETLPPEEIARRESDFVEHAMLVLLKNHYNVLTQKEWDAATDQDFLLNLPVNVRWTAMHDGLLERTCWSQYPRLAEIYPRELRSRILILHRGISSTSMVGSFYGQKVEMLVSYLVVQPILTVLLWIAKTVDVFGWFVPKVEKSDVGSFYVNQTVHGTKRYGGEDLGLGEGEQVMRKKPRDRQDDMERVLIRRHTFDKEFPNTLNIIRKFFKTVTLQEACFRDVVVLYRANESGRQKGEFSLRSNMEERVIQNNIVMKRFSSIPLADMELVFPEKNVHFSPSTMVNIAVTIIGAIVTLILSIRGGLSLTSAWTSLTVLAGRVVQVWQTATTQKTEIERSMGQIVSSRTVATQGAALSSVISDMFSQLTRQIFLAYCVLAAASAKKETLTVEQLDQRCERILNDEFECRVDFTCDQALEILSLWGVVSESTNGGLSTLVPVEPQIAVRKLETVLIAASSAQPSFVDSLAGFRYMMKGVAGAGVGRVTEGVGRVTEGVAGGARRTSKFFRFGKPKKQ